MKKTISIIILLTILFSCSKTDEIVNKNEKQDFFVQTKKLNDFNGFYEISKTGKISSSQDIIISSNANGRIKNINVKEGQQVKQGDVLINLEDNIGNIKLNVDKTKNLLEKAKINYSSTELTLDKQIFDSKINLEKLQDSYNANEKDQTENLKKLNKDIENSKLTTSQDKISTSKEKLETQIAKLDLGIEKLNDSIKKLEFDYNTKITSDKESIDGYKNNLSKELESLKIYFDDVIDFGDKLFGVTDLNKNYGSSIDSYLGAKNTSQKEKTKTLFYEFMEHRKTLNNISLTQDKLLDSLKNIESGYNKVNELLTSIEITLNNSIGSISFSDSVISSNISKTNIFQGTYQGNYSSFVSFSNGLKIFLNTYLDNQESIKKQIEITKKDLDLSLKDKESLLKDKEILEKDSTILSNSLETGELGADINYNKSIISYEDRKKGLELQIKTAENTLENNQKTKEITLKSLKNAIEQAEIDYKMADLELSKLNIISPISGTIKEISFDKGQEVKIGNQLISLSNTTSTQIEISFNKDELNYIQEGNSVIIDNNEKTITGSIYSISKVADKNLNYTAKILFDSKNTLVGDIKNLKIPVKIEGILIPINLVTIGTNKEVGIINYLDNGQFSKIEVKLGKVYGNAIIIQSCKGVNEKEFKECDNIDLILNDMTNFDKEKFILKVKNEDN